MQIGSRVQYSGDLDKGVGVIIGQQDIFQASYAEVFFVLTGEKLVIPEAELIEVLSAEAKIRKQHFSPVDRFLLRLFKEKIKASYTGEGLQASANFKILPLPHQLLTVKYVLDQPSPRVLIADEVGLGKTIEAALVYEELKTRGMVTRAMIIAPSGLCIQWQEELKQKFNEEFVIYDRETVQALKHLYGQETNVWSIKDRILTSLDFIKPKRISDELDESLLNKRVWHNRNVYEAASQAGFDLVIIDEAHKLTKDMSGEETARYKAGKAFAESCPCFVLLSATPHQGDSAKFMHLLNLIEPHLFYRGSDVNPENVKKISVRNNKRAVVDFNGKRLFKQRITSLCSISRDNKEDKIELRLYEAVSEYVSEFYDLARQNHNHTMMFLLLLYQRMVSSSSRAIWKSLSNRLNMLKSMLEKAEDELQVKSNNHIEMDEIEELDTEALMVYLDNVEIEYFREYKCLQAEIIVLEHCVELARQASLGRNDAKFKKLLEIVDEFKIRENDPDLKFIIFTEFIETQYYLNDCLQNMGYRTACINGHMSSEDKQASRDVFRNHAQFLISTDAGGEGINLQFCRVMINYDLPWNPMRLEQRIGRIDRIGQEYDVKIINLQLTDTVEQRVRSIIEKKLGKINREFNDGEDKLSDILSTLQDEFSFENLYIDAVKKREKDLAGLEKLSEDIYQRAAAIIGNGELALPFSQLEENYKVSSWELEKKAQETQHLLDNYLQISGSALMQYRNRSGVYYFDDPCTGRR